MKHVSILLLAFLLAVGVSAVSSETEPSEQAPSERAREGGRLYEFYCVNCHGPNGAGDGPTAEVLSVPPANLTTLASDNGGEFPADRVIRSIDGRERNAAHGSAMPIWGLGFQDGSSDLDQEHEVKRRIEALTEFLRSIQAE